MATSGSRGRRVHLIAGLTFFDPSLRRAALVVEGHCPRQLRDDEVDPEKARLDVTQPSAPLQGRTTSYARSSPISTSTFMSSLMVTIVKTQIPPPGSFPSFSISDPTCVCEAGERRRGYLPRRPSFRQQVSLGRTPDDFRRPVPGCPARLSRDATPFRQNLPCACAGFRYRGGAHDSRAPFRALSEQAPHLP